MAKSAHDRLLDGVQKLRGDKSHVALSAPSGKTEYDYGHACGYYQALCDVLAMSKQQLEEEKNSD